MDSLSLDTITYHKYIFKNICNGTQFKLNEETFVDLGTNGPAYSALLYNCSSGIFLVKTVKNQNLMLFEETCACSPSQSNMS